MHRAFTLVEALVAIAIVAILIGILVPSLAAVRMQALATQDLGNLRSLMQAHLAYMNVNNERFVDVGLPHGTPADPSLSFVHRLRPFFGNAAVALRSPLDRSPHWQVDDGGEDVPVAQGATPIWRYTSYGMNNYLSRTFSPLVALDGPNAAIDRLSQVGSPESTVCFLLMADSGPYASADHPHVEEWSSAPDPALHAASQCRINAVSGTRPSTDSRSNYAFLDGRTATKVFDDVYRSGTINQFDPLLH
ncbi:MAG: type II secretion system protein [Phycisphaerae bacterium]|nr:type II secretion system protein [Phycisphaerae bacterium]